MTELEKILKRLPGYINTASEVLLDIMEAITDKISELDTEIASASEINQSKKRLFQILKEWGLNASSVCGMENLQMALRNRYKYHQLRGSGTGILNDIELLCNSGADIFTNPPTLEWYLDVNYPFWGEDVAATYFEFQDIDAPEIYYYGLAGIIGYYEGCKELALDFSNACFGYLVDLGIAVRFAIDNNALTKEQVLAILNEYSLPIHIDVFIDVVDDSFNYMMLEQHLNWI